MNEDSNKEFKLEPIDISEPRAPVQQEFAQLPRDSNLSAETRSSYPALNFNKKGNQKCGDFAKYVVLLVVVMVLTIGGSQLVHRSDVAELQKEMEINQKMDTQFVKRLKKKITSEYKNLEKDN